MKLATVKRRRPGGAYVVTVGGRVVFRGSRRDCVNVAADRRALGMVGVKVERF